MNRFRLLAAGTILAFALTAAAQQTPTSPEPHAMAVAPVDQHLKALSDKLALTADQQEKARPILQEMHDSSQKLNDDQSMTPDQRQAAMAPIMMKADKALREILTDDQRQKLDELEAQMHGSHDNPGAHPSAPQK